MLTHLFLLVLLTSLAIYGWKYSTLYDTAGIKDHPDGGKYDIGVEKGELFWWVPFYFRNWTAFYAPGLQVLYKPLFGCLTCMAGPYGTLSYWSYVWATNQALNLQTLLLWIVTVAAVAGLNQIIRTLAPRM